MGNISSQKVVAACKAGRVIGATRDSTNKWIIPIDARRPIDEESIRLILIALLCIKNKPSTNVDEIERKHIQDVLEYLEKIGMIEHFDCEESIELHHIILTDKAIHVATEGKKNSVNWLEAGAKLIELIANIATIWQAVSK